MKNLTLKLLTERNKDFNGISRPALYFSTTCDTKSFLVGWYNSLTPSPWTTPMDLVHGLLEWTTLNGPPGICGKHKFNDAGT